MNYVKLVKQSTTRHSKQPHELLISLMFLSCFEFVQAIIVLLTEGVIYVCMLFMLVTCTCNTYVGLESYMYVQVRIMAWLRVCL